MRPCVNVPSPPEQNRKEKMIEQAERERGRKKTVVMLALSRESLEDSEFKSGQSYVAAHSKTPKKLIITEIKIFQFFYSHQQ